MAAILQTKNNPDWVKYAKHAVALFEITTKLELHDPSHDAYFAELRRVLNSNNIK